MLYHWQILLRIEKAALSHPGLKGIIDCVVWKGWPLNRLLFLMIEVEGADPEASGTDYILQAMHKRLPDEKAAEDIHQFLRDECRRQRYKNVAPLRVMRAAIEADIPTKRRIDGIGVSIEELCHTTRYDSATQKAVRHRFFEAPKRAPPCLTKITSARRAWHSPNTNT